MTALHLAMNLFRKLEVPLNAHSRIQATNQDVAVAKLLLAKSILMRHGFISDKYPRASLSASYKFH